METIRRISWRTSHPLQRTSQAVLLLLTSALLSACGHEATLRMLEITPPVTEVTEHLRSAVTVTAIYSDGARRDVTAEVTWTPMDEAIATASGDTVQAGVPGTTFLSAAWGGLEIPTRVDVRPALLLSLRVEVVAVSLAAGLAFQVTALGTYSDGSIRDVTDQVEWRSDEDAVEVGEGHLILASALGAATLHASLGEVAGEVVLQVTEATPVSLALTGLTQPLAAGDGAALHVLATFTDGTTREVTGEALLTIADPSVAGLEDGGGLVALAAGATTVQATWRALAAAAQVQVSAAVLRTISVACPGCELEVGHNVHFTAAGTYSDGAVRDVTLTCLWASSDTSVALAYAFMPKGTIFLRTTGTTTVSATDLTTGVSGSSLLEIGRDD